MKDLKFRKISTSIDKKLPIIKIKDITDDIKKCILDVVIDKVYIEKKDDRTYIKLYVSDSFNSIYALSIQENKYYDEIINNIKLHNRYHIMGYLIDYNKGLGKEFNLYNEDKILLIQAMEDITENEINKYFEDKLCGESLICLYDLSLEDSYEFIKKNFNYLDKIKLEEIKKIKFSWTHDIIVLLKNGNLLINDKKKINNIKDIVFINGSNIFAITNEYQIISVLNESTSSLIFNNNNYKYKKIYYDYSKIIALTYDGKLKIYGDLLDKLIDSDRLTNIQDIGVSMDGKNDIVVVQDGLIYSLFSKTIYKNDKNNEPDVIVEGEGLKYSILVSKE